MEYNIFNELFFFVKLSFSPKKEIIIEKSFNVFRLSFDYLCVFVYWLQTYYHKPIQTINTSFVKPNIK